MILRSRRGLPTLLSVRRRLLVMRLAEGGGQIDRRDITGCSDPAGETGTPSATVVATPICRSGVPIRIIRSSLAGMTVASNGRHQAGQPAIRRTPGGDYFLFIPR